VALVDRQLVAVLDGAADLVDVGEVDLGVDALGEQVHAQGDQVDVAGALAVAEQAALDPVGAGQQPSSAAATAVPRSLCGCSDRRSSRAVEVAESTRSSRHTRWGCIISTVAGRLMIILRSGVGSMTSMTALQISTANSSSVPV
jgi:hypothetical protein